MAVLSDADRKDIWAAFMDESTSSRDKLDVSKTELRAAVNAIDQFLDANAAALNNAIPAAPRAKLTAAQKARLLVAVVRRRHLRGA